MAVAKVFRRGQKAVVASEDGQEYEADFLVAADGSESRLVLARIAKYGCHLFSLPAISTKSCNA